MSGKRTELLASPGLPDRIREARINLGMERRDFGELIGVGVDTIGYWERGVVAPRVKNLASIAHHSGVSIQWLRKGDDNGRYEPGLDTHSTTHWVGATLTSPTTDLSL